MRRFAAAVVVSLFACADASVAQSVSSPAGTPAAPSGCELHVWPGEGLTSIFYGFLHGGIVNGGQQGRRGYPRVPPDVMSATIQTELLAAAQPQRLMNLAGHNLVVHGEALSSRTIRGTAGRISPSGSPCYAELMVDEVVLQQDWVNGAKLRVLFRYRDFGADAQPRRSFTTWADADLDSFPPQTEAALPTAVQEMRAAFRRSLEIFAGQLLQPPRRR